MSVFKTGTNRQLRLNFLLPKQTKKPPIKKHIPPTQTVIDIQASKPTPKPTTHKTTSHNHVHTFVYIVCFLPMWILKYVHRANTHILHRYNQLIEKQTNTI